MIEQLRRFVSIPFAVLFAMKSVDRIKSDCINVRMFADSTCLWSRLFDTSALQSKASKAKLHIYAILSKVHALCAK